MPEMTTLCQEGNGTPPAVFGARGQQGAPPQEPPQNFYSQCGYPQPHSLPPPPPPPLHPHYNSESFNSFQSSQADHQHQMGIHHHQHLQQYQQHQQQQQQQHHQQYPPHLQHQHHWGYGMGGSEIRGGSGEEWGHGYYFHHQTGGYHGQNPYGYQYRTPQHPNMDYGSPLPINNETERNGEEVGSPSPRSGGDGEGAVDAPGCGPNNQGAKSLRPPYEWMKPSPSLPQPGE
ncbi:hypothetical protein RRG08_040630 [Elysia crispata]|uniref:Uncharacterized protein n=1 Tax=Elysia crispata TaxID=231223 RepID=A0AAE1B3N2_9GAST|nr:hypothetical protein RRG08_040630 [Elysia crispata]